MNALEMAAHQGKIEHILDSRFTPGQIADNYLNTPFDKRALPPDPDFETKGRRRIADNRGLSAKLNNRAEPERLISEIVKAVGFYEIPVLCEHRQADIAELTEHLDSASHNLEELQNDISAISRVLEQPLTPKTKIELMTRRNYLQEVAEQGYIRISRQQEIALLWLIHTTPETIPLIKAFILSREPNQPNQVYTQALALIVFRLIESRAQKAIHNVSANSQITIEAISTISPPLKKYITARVLRAARIGQ